MYKCTLACLYIIGMMYYNIMGMCGQLFLVRCNEYYGRDIHN